MLFNSLDFLIFFPIVFIIFVVIPARFRTFWLLACSYFFYMCWNPKCILLILLSTVATYLSGIAMEKFTDSKRKKAILISCIVINLAILFFFKYFNFMLDTVGFISGHKFNTLNIILPVGISFYTFQALGYAIDCYRGDIRPERNFIRYALFVSFFPQLVAGPIERSGNLLGQIKKIGTSTRKELLNVQRIQEGFILMVWGMFMKLVISDRIAVIVDNVYTNCNLYGTVGLLMAFFGFGIQIYCDFGSYSIIAIGAAKIMSINLMENFNAPYLATSVTDFWRKWHISLSSWFRDYLYIPLGGNRKGFIRKLVNIMIVFICSGLWHGAQWTFVFWGFMHGLAQVIENLLKPVLHKIEKYFDVNKSTAGFMLCRAVVVTVFVNLAWVFFRAESFDQAFTFIRRLLTKPDWWRLFDGTIYTYGLDEMEIWILAISLVMLMTVDLIRNRKGLTVDKWLMGEFTLFRIFVVVIVIVMTVMFGEYGPGFDSQEFIYFQF